ncbi:hypothetical protein [Tardiphaga sp.]|uniref:hypothetical protein n=1 Tax=Tardiphaga sp. TaxID=1926292 RepID=UPI0026249E0E|nr:hypothetical protein [Tardiphaga sp.]MDB5617452.1 hypothetical protein [Tardiphaga sp.]
MTVLEWLSPPHVPAKQDKAEFDPGILIFCGIGLLLSLAAMTFGWFDLPGTVGY